MQRQTTPGCRRGTCRQQEGHEHSVWTSEHTNQNQVTTWVRLIIANGASPRM